MPAPELRPVQLIEFFHLAFLEVLRLRLNLIHYVLKGGASMRFFYGSPRYSEDMDFDVDGVPRHRLERRVDDVLTSRPLRFILGSQGLRIETVSKPKQTETTQRWKISLTREAGDQVRTRLEFSRRGVDPRHRLEQIPAERTALYGLPPPTVQRYLPEALIEQKVRALASRLETQARDIFDLDLLFRAAPEALSNTSLDTRTLHLAAERILDLSFEAYQAQVVAFLDPDVLELYDRPEAWERLRAHVLQELTTYERRSRLR
ncbi:MAG: nucleotidyl transferase AbiEii/AbiGii toxin family protein [Armatimonadota bacterium]|nr:nucleotidyl transferase AbiEii/AbiGii toxin family protein [Armatimonadota bacterium]MDR7584880.1 nucleotidyl transferase AbiEii/AbiGii toxin family protein [Armatimonadota bacterium]